MVNPGGALLIGLSVDKCFSTIWSQRSLISLMFYDRFLVVTMMSSLGLVDLIGVFRWLRNSSCSAQSDVDLLVLVEESRYWRTGGFPHIWHGGMGGFMTFP